jgi:hypothetical protein
MLRYDIQEYGRQELLNSINNDYGFLITLETVLETSSCAANM